ncbi:MAG: hypothetical protein ACTSXX_13570 [Candidatus Baldrarchaeia archaeon]
MDTSDRESIIEGIARRTMNLPMVRQSISFSDVWINDVLRICEELKADCVI